MATGFPFGAYAYAGALGPTLLGVPLVIPLAWAMDGVAGVAGRRCGSAAAPLARVAVAAAGPGRLGPVPRPADGRRGPLALAPTPPPRCPACRPSR